MRWIFVTLLSMTMLLAGCGELFPRVSCDMAPTCPDGYETAESGDCEDDDEECTEVTECDSTITCKPCSEELSCREGDEEVESEQDCPDDAEDCYQESACQEAIWCWSDEESD